MSKITEVAFWEPTIYQADTSKPNKAGPAVFDSNGEATDGFLNAGVQQVTNRTAYLKETLDDHIGSRGSAHTNATTTEAGFMSASDKTKLNGIETGAQVNVATNLAQGTRTTTTVPVTSSTGTSATLGVATTSLAGVMSSADKTKLDGIAAGAQVNVATNLSTSYASTTVSVTSSTGTTALLNSATTSLAGVLSAADKTKLDGIATGAQVNVVTSVASKTGAVTLVKGDVGLSNVDNTADIAKPVSTAQQTALNLKADLASPILTGVPTAPTAIVGTNSTQLATTAFVMTSVGSNSQNMIQVQDQKTSGTGGGTPLSSGLRTLNTTVVNQISGASLGANVITLPAGNYYTEAYSTFSGTALYRIQIYNNTDSTPLLEGLSIAGSGAVSITSFANGYFTLATSKTVGIYYQASSTPTNGLGLPASRGTEVYSDLRIWKLL